MEEKKEQKEQQEQQEQQQEQTQTQQVDPELLAKLQDQQGQMGHFPQESQLKRIFWDTQPVPQEYDLEVESGPIDPIKTVEEIRDEPYKLPDAFEWCEVDLTNDQELENVYQHLVQNYVEDEDNMFRFDYSKEFLRWALNPPDYFKDWIIGVKVKKSGKLVGFITGIPVTLNLDNKSKIKMTEINFLCVNKKLRSNRLAPVLIKEITRRVNKRNMWQAVYTAGVVVPTPLAKARYFHRSLNPKKLIEINFSCLGKNQTMSRVIQVYKVPEQPSIEGLREMKKKDISAVQKLLNTYLDKFKLYQKFSDEDVKHFLLPRNEVIYTYVVEKDIDGKKVVTDFFSFYYLPSSILKHPKHKVLRAVYSYYNVATSMPLKELMQQALIVAKQNDFDVFNALDIQDNSSFLKDLKFSPGDGNLHYYLYNWRLQKSLQPQELGMVLV